MAKPTTVKSSWKALPARVFLCNQEKRRTMTEKMVVRKYDPVARKHVEFKENKIK